MNSLRVGDFVYLRYAASEIMGRVGLVTDAKPGRLRIQVPGTTSSDGSDTWSYTIDPMCHHESWLEPVRPTAQA